MNIDSGIWPEILTWLPFTIALAFGWAGQRRAALPFLAATAGLGWWFGLLSSGSIVLFSACLAAAAWLPHVPVTVSALRHALLILACLVLGLELIPGVERLPVATEVQTGPASVAFTYSIGLEKPLAFFLLLFAVPKLLTLPPERTRRAMAVSLLILGSLFAVGLAAHVVRWETSFPAWAPIFIVGNLLLTCLPEEAFFRGYLQSGLASRLGPASGIAISSVVFGLAHLGGGIVVAVFAAVAGVAFGLAYQFGGGLRSAVLVHFGFNLVHLTLFTYPVAAS